MSVKTDFPDGLARCAWLDHSDIYIAYHDHEWGLPQADERALFEQLCLEGFQAGLSWRTILNKRSAFRQAFANFELEPLAAYGEPQVAALLENAGIVRHQGKIRAVINNARRALELREQGGSLAAYFWSFAESPRSVDAVPRSSSPQALALSKALKKQGWAFVGPTTVYAFMQAVGMVNDHNFSCHAHSACVAARRAFSVPVK